MDNHDTLHSENEKYPESSSLDNQPVQAREDNLEAYIRNILHERARQIHIPPTLHQGIMRQLPSRQKVNADLRRRKMMLVCSSALAALLILTLTLYSVMAHVSHAPVTPQMATITFHAGSTLDTPVALANGGQLISIDPTGHNLVYMPANQPGVLYTTALNAPVTDNLLAMRYADDIAWSPDGTALVTTVRPQGVFEPLLALVPVGHYMHLLGHDALAASWLPNVAQGITFVTASHGATQLWQTDVNGTAPRLLATMPLSQPAQHLYWSPDGRLLALVIGNGNTTTPPSLSQPGRVMYVMNSRTGGLQEIVPSGNFTIGNVIWSPDGQALSYQQIDGQGHSTLHVIAASTGQPLAIITIHAQLQGWSWSPDSHTLIYSDGGILHTHTFHGVSVRLPAQNAQAAYPFWLANGNILYLRITNGIGQLALLMQGK